VASERGYQVIRLPPDYSQCNPIELVRAQAKRDIAKREEKSSTSNCTVPNLLIRKRYYVLFLILAFIGRLERILTIVYVVQN
jgi:hypothetical protein